MKDCQCLGALSEKKSKFIMASKTDQSIEIALKDGALKNSIFIKTKYW